jgi:integrase/recombinase XerD
MRGLTCSTFFGLVASTGLRISEALALNPGDIDTTTGVVRVRKGKLGRERILPLDPTVLELLFTYASGRDRLLGHTPKALFVRCKGDRLSEWSARYNFAQVCQQIGLRSPEKFGRHGRGPRIHDLRHTFAVQTMINWYRTGKDPALEMIRLSIWLGHSKTANTFWYIEAVPELLELAMERATHFTREVAQ